MNKILVRIEYILFRLPLPKVIHDKTVHLFFKQDIEIYNPNGINPNKTFYIIRNHHKDVGLMSYHNTVYYHILRAVNMGAIPIIDMMNYPNTYLKNSKLGKENSWNYFFEQAPVPWKNVTLFFLNK